MGIIANGPAAPEFSDIITTTKKPSVGIDYVRYESMLDDPTMSKADKRILIDALWSVISGFVELGFNVHPFQQAQDAALEAQSLKAIFSAASCGKVTRSDSESISADVNSPIEETAKGGPQ